MAPRTVRRTKAGAGASASPLSEYRARRDFAVTTEPAPGRVAPSSVPSFVVHKHDATRLHYDVRLEIDGALASWSVPKGPSLDPAIKRLAVQTEDHPLEYGGFEGRIPDGEYGAGDSLIWDRGTCDSVPPGQLSQQRKKGHVHVRFAGEKLKGEWHLVRTRGGASGKAQWLLFKARDGLEDAAVDLVAERPESVVSGRVATRGPERQSVLRAPRAAPEKLLEPLLPPMLATLVDEAPAGAWVAEWKIDGFRALCALSSGRVAVWSRNGLDLASRFPAVAKALGRLVVGDAVIDGEIAVLDPAGAPRFELLQQGGDAVLYAFDLLRLDGADLRARPLRERRELLESLLSNAPPALRVVEQRRGDLAGALDEARRRGFEGLVLKQPEGSYEKGRSRGWLKLKVQTTQELAVVGWMPGKGAAQGGVGALLLAVADGRGGFAFAGKVGTGFSAKQRRELERELRKDEADASPATGAPRLREARWVIPRLVAQVRFTEWTADGKLRHPALQGFRSDKKPEECVRERAVPPPGDSTTPPKRTRPAARAPAPRTAAAAPAAIPLTHPDKLLYPDDGLRKEDVAAYYAAVAAPLLRALRDRPLVFLQWSSGIGKKPVFRQDVARERRPWMDTVETPSGTARGSVLHLVASDAQALRWLAQMNALELHAWHSHRPSLTTPDWVVFDLDPAQGQGIGQAVEVATILHGMFDALGLPSAVKTTGRRGLHVLVPLQPGHTFADAQAFALEVGETVVKQLPKLVTLERPLAARKGRLYFDCLQNAYGKTIVAPWSLRGAPGAPVSTPLRWSEVVPGLDPAGFNLRTVPGRLAEVGDPFEAALSQGVRLPRFGKR